MNLGSIERQVLSAASDDYTGLWLVIRFTREAYPELGSEMIRARVLSIILELLRSRLIEAGDLSPDFRTFIPWSMSPERTVSRIDTEWELMDDEPSIWDIVWFRTTEHGERVVRALHSIEVG